MSRLGIGRTSAPTVWRDEAERARPPPGRIAGPPPPKVEHSHRQKTQVPPPLLCTSYREAAELPGTPNMKAQQVRRPSKQLVQCKETWFVWNVGPCSIRQGQRRQRHRVMCEPPSTSNPGAAWRVKHAPGSRIQSLRPRFASFTHTHIHTLARTHHFDPGASFTPFFLRPGCCADVGPAGDPGIGDPNTTHGMQTPNTQAKHTPPWVAPGVCFHNRPLNHPRPSALRPEAICTGAHLGALTPPRDPHLGSRAQAVDTRARSVDGPGAAPMEGLPMGRIPPAARRAGLL